MMQQTLNIRNYLSPLLRSIWDTRNELDRTIALARLQVARGLIPPSKIRTDILMKSEKLLADIRLLVKRYATEKEAKEIEEFEENLAKMELELRKYKEEAVIRVRENIAHKVLSFLEAYSIFAHSILDYVFDELSIIISLNPQKVFEPLEKYARELVMNRIGKRIFMEEERERMFRERE